MTTRKPLVINGGNTQQLQSGDYLDPTTLGSGTASNTTFLRGDNTWQTVSGSGSTVASGISFTPTGNVSSTDVQSAIAELDTKKAPLASPSFTAGASFAGAVTGVTAATSDSSTTLATTAYVNSLFNTSRINVLSYIPAAQWSAIQTGTCSIDLTSYFNNAIAALPSGGGEILVPPGLYPVNLTVSKQSVTIRGTGTNVSNGAFTNALVPYAVANPVLTVGTDQTSQATNPLGFKLADISLYAVGPNGTGSYALKLYGGAQYGTYQNIGIVGFGARGLWLQGGINWPVTQNNFSNLNIVSASGNSDACLYLNYSSTQYVTACSFSNLNITNTSGNGHAIYNESCDLVINGGWIECTSLHGIQMLGTYNTPIIRSGGLWIDSPYSNDVLVEVPGSGIPVPNNYLIGNISLDGAVKSPAAGTSVSIASISRSGSTATVTTSAAHGFATNDNIYVSGAAQSNYNGVFIITVTGTATFTYTVPSTTVTPATGTLTAVKGNALLPYNAGFITPYGTVQNGATIVGTMTLNKSGDYRQGLSDFQVSQNGSSVFMLNNIGATVFQQMQGTQVQVYAPGSSSASKFRLNNDSNQVEIWNDGNGNLQLRPDTNRAVLLGQTANADGVAQTVIDGPMRHFRRTQYTSSTLQNDWFPVGTLDITAQYGEVTGELQLALDGQSGDTASTGFVQVQVRVKQQAAMAAAPIVELLAPVSQTFQASQIVGVLTANSASHTTLTLYVQNTHQYEYIRYSWRNLTVNTGTFTPAADGATGVQTLPAGTQYTPSIGVVVDSSGAATLTGMMKLYNNGDNAQIEFNPTNGTSFHNGARLNGDSWYIWNNTTGHDLLNLYGNGNLVITGAGGYSDDGNTFQVKGSASINGSVSLGSSLKVNGGALATRTAVTYAATLTLDCSTADTFDITLTGNATLNFSNARDGQRIEVRLIQDATGSRTVTWGTMCSFGSQFSSITLSTAANKTDYIGLVYSAAAGKYHVVSYNLGF